MYKAIPITDSCESCYMIIDKKGEVICSDVVSKEYAERIAKALNRDELFDKVVGLLSGYPKASITDIHEFHEAMNAWRLEKETILTKINKEKEIKAVK